MCLAVAELIQQQEDNHLPELPSPGMGELVSGLLFIIIVLLQLSFTF